MKKWITLLLAAAMLLTLLAGCGSADTAETTTTTGGSYSHTVRELGEAKYIEAAQAFSGGTGTAEDPYQIATAAELALLADCIAQEAESLETHYHNAHYVLTADIALNDTTDVADWAKKGPEYSWKPIDGMNINCVLDGNGHTISGMYINANGETGNTNFGLFAKMNNGTVKNLTIDQSYICVSGAAGSVGGIVGYTLSGCTIENCAVNVTIDVYDGTVGGIVGTLGGGRVAGESYANDEVAPCSNVMGCTFGGTITQVKEGAVSYIGGIAGSSSGNITRCANQGTIRFGGGDTDCVGGIAGKAGEGKISDCENAGSLDCALSAEETVGARVGGIVGNLFLSATGSEEYMSRGVTVENCRNSGDVSGQTYAGGIVGSAANDHNDWCLTISGCVNSGEVVSAGYTGGIVGHLSAIGDNVNGENVVIESCRNEAALSKGTVGGVIGQFVSETGDVLIRDCENTGDLSTEGQHCAGLIAYWMMNSHADIRVSVEGCANSGTIESPLSAGGILSYADLPVSVEVEGTTALTIRDCTNSGEIIVNGENGYVGGIAGCWGMEAVNASFEGCVNTGTITMNNTAPEQEALEGSNGFVISRICGGIIGRVGSGLLLTTDSDEGSAEHVNGASAWLTIRDCSSTGALNVADTEEYTNANGDVIRKNYFGGIVGNTCGEAGFALKAEGCTYSGFDRGLGNEEYPDLG